MFYLHALVKVQATFMLHQHKRMLQLAYAGFIEIRFRMVRKRFQIVRVNGIKDPVYNIYPRILHRR